MLTLATLGLSFPLMLRSIIDLLRFAVPSFEKYVDDNASVYSIFSHLFLNLVPICFQLSILIFGYIRERDNKKYRLEVQKAKTDYEKGDLLFDG